MSKSIVEQITERKLAAQKALDERAASIKANEDAWRLRKEAEENEENQRKQVEETERIRLELLHNAELEIERVVAEELQRKEKETHTLQRSTEQTEELVKFYPVPKPDERTLHLHTSEAAEGTNGDTLETAEMSSHLKLILRQV